MPNHPVCGFFRFCHAFRPAGWFLAVDPAPGSEHVPWGDHIPLAGAPAAAGGLPPGWSVEVH